MSEFDDATAVHDRGDGRVFDIDIDAGWTVGPNPNGGYLLATLARAAGEGLGSASSAHRDPLAATAHYLAAPDPGPAEVRVEVLRVGRGASQVRATLDRDGRACVDATFTMGTLPTDPPPPWWTTRELFDVAPIEDLRAHPREPGGVAVRRADHGSERLSARPGGARVRSG